MSPPPPRQLPLDLGHRPALGRDDFLVAASNHDAVAWIDRWPEWPNRTLALYGPAGCGKTHLAHVFAGRTGAAIVPINKLDPAALGAVKAVVIEDADRLTDERPLLHAINSLRELGRGLLLTGEVAPARWPIKLPDLASRLRALTAVGIDPPGDDLFAAVLVKLFADRQIQIAPDVVTYLMRRIDRSFDAARRIVAAADAGALAEGRAVTIPLVRRLTEGGEPS